MSILINPDLDKLVCKKCGHISYVCYINKSHKKNCAFRRAATCSVAIACEPHGRDTCPICDKCDCDNLSETKKLK